MKIKVDDKYFEPSGFIGVYKDSKNTYYRNVAIFLEELFNRSISIKQFTSGSTGKPKEINLFKSNMRASAAKTIHFLGLDKGDHLLLSLNPAYIGGKMMIVRAVEQQMNLVLGDVSNSPITEQLIKNHKIDFFSFVPSQIQTLLSKKKSEQIDFLNQAKAIILGGAPVSFHLQQLIRQYIQVPIYSTFGMTETVSHVALKDLLTDSPFEALEGVTFSVDQHNCLCIHAKELSNQETLRTNDVVELINNKQFHWKGRIDFVVNSGGVKLHPETIERKISEFMVRKNKRYKFFLFGKPDEKLGEKLCMCIEKNDDPDLLNELKKILPSYEVPKELFSVPEFVYANNKLNRLLTIERYSIN